MFGPQFKSVDVFTIVMILTYMIQVLTARK